MATPTHPTQVGRQSHISIMFGQAVLAFARAPVMLVLVVGFASSILFAVHQLHADAARGLLPIAACGLLVIALFAAAGLTARRVAPFAPLPFLLATLIVGTVLRATYVTCFDPVWVSDFAQYWKTGIDLASRETLSVRTIYDQRALFLATPVIWLFGESRTALEGANVLFALLIQLAGYDIARRAASHQAAQAFTLIWLGTAEPLLVLALPNHDLLALAFIATATWVSVATVARRGAPAGLALAGVAGLIVGVLVSLLEAVRGVGTIYLLTAVLVCGAASVLLALRGRWRDPSLRAHLLHTVCLALAFAATQAILVRNGLVMPERNAALTTLRYTTSHATTLSDGTYRRMRALHDALAKDLMSDPVAFSDFRRALAFSDFTNAPFTRAWASATRIPRQYALGTQLGFYLSGMPPELVRTMRIYNAWFLGVFGLCFVVATLRLSRRPAQLPVIGAMLLLGSALSLTLLLIGENQPRYMFSLWFIGALAIGAGFARHPPGDAQPASLISVVGAPILGLVLFVAALGGLMRLGYDASDGRIPAQWSFDGDVPEAPTHMARLQSRPSSVLRSVYTNEIMPLAFGPLSLKLELASPPAHSQWARAQTEVCGLDDAPRWLTFQYDAPAKHLRGRGAFSLEAWQDDTLLWRNALPNADGVERVQLPLVAPGGSGCSRIGFTLSTTTSYDRTSWQRASLVEIFFPRITMVAPLPPRGTVQRR